MLKVKNNDIYLTRGENAVLPIKIWNSDGTPFVIPADSCMEFSLKAFADIGFNYVAFYTPIACIQMTLKFNKRATSGKIICIMNGEEDSFDFDGEEVSLSFENMCFVTSIRFNDAELESVIFAEPDSWIERTLRNDITEISTIVFTVRSSLYDSIVLQKIINTHGAITQDGATDYIFGGWNKFTSNTIYIENNSLSNLYDKLIEEHENGVIRLGKFKDNYYHLVRSKSGSYDIKPYEFSITIPIEHIDTANLEAKGYTYDIIAYKGEANEKLFDDLCNCLGYDKIYWKRELIPPHNFTIGDSNNA